VADLPPPNGHIRRHVNAFCPRCCREDPLRPLEDVRRLSGYLAEADGRVWLVRDCPEHGRLVTLYEEDAEILDYLERWTAPTKGPTPDTPDNFASLPAAYLEGLGGLQTQHTCILLEDVTETCNLRCPTCYAESSPRLGGVAEVADVLANIDRRLEREGGRLDVLMVSGGEPTLHPRLTDLLEAAMQRDIVRILVNTNGLELAKDDRLLRFLAEHSRRIEVYLQFDGFRASTHRHHRGADLGEIKRRAVERLAGAGVFTTLTMTAEKGVNDDEIGDVVRFALETPFVGGVCVQPVFGSGRSAGIDPIDRLTGTGVLKRLGPQTGGLVTWRDLTALPCSHPHCSAVGYMIQADRGTWRSLVGLVGHEELRAHLDLVSNRIVDPHLAGDLKLLVAGSLYGLLSEQSSLAHPRFRHLFLNVAGNRDLGLGSLLRSAGTFARGNGSKLRRLMAERVKRLTVKPFMDVDTMIEERLLQCCVHVGTVSETQHQCVPFCAAQAWPRLGRMKLAAASTHARTGAGSIGPAGFRDSGRGPMP
jgi:hypothetical protein